MPTTNSTSSSLHDKLHGKTAFITGCSRGIGRAIALRLAREHVNIAVVAKTSEPHPKLTGTIHSVAAEIESLGGKAIAIQCDIRNEQQVKKALDQTFQKFGRIDFIINNASAISLTGTEETTMKKYDLMQAVNARGTFMVSKLAIPYLKRNSNSHILNLSPPLLMESGWFKSHTAYTISKYGMSMCVLGMSGELSEFGIAVNALWPKSIIATEALNAIAINKEQVDEITRGARKADIVADAAAVILSKESAFTGNFCIDEDVLKNECEMCDLSKYAVNSSFPLQSDLFIPNAKL